MSQVFGDFGSIGKFSLIESASVVMYCDNTSMPNTPPPSVPSVPTIPSQKGLEEMCMSLRRLISVFNTSDTVSGKCSISDNCLTVNCSLDLQTRAGFKIPLALSVTLLPCQSPFAIYVKAEITFFGQTISLADGTYSRNATIPVRIAFISGTVNMVIIQQDCGILLSVSSQQLTMVSIMLGFKFNTIVYT